MDNRTFKEMGIDSFPLKWPENHPREISHRRKSARFDRTFERCRKDLFRELKLMGVNDYNAILSTNLPLRKDGFPYAESKPAGGDPGVAVYFRYKNKPMVFACDKWKKVEDNLRAIVMTIEALRGIQRWAASDMMEKAFTGFMQLPPPPKAREKKPWWEVLGVNKYATAYEIELAWKRLIIHHHPDRGGDESLAADINRARDEAMSMPR